MEETVDEVKDLKGCINNVISILALPAIWAGGEAQQIVAALLDALLGMLRLDFVYVALKGTGGSVPIEMIRFTPSGESAGQRRIIDKVLQASLRCETQTWPLVVQKPTGDGDISIAVFPFGLNDEMGVLVAASRRADFPDATERLLLNVASNQATIGLKEARLLGEQRRLAEELDQRVAQRTRELQRSEFYLQQGQLLSHCGSWSFLLSGECDYWSPELYKILGFDPSKGIPPLSEYVKLVHPDDRSFVEQTLQNMIAKGVGCDIKKRIVRPDGALRVIRCVGIPLLEMGKAVRFVGTLMDITEQENLTQGLRRSEFYLQEGERLACMGSWSLTPDGIFDYWSPETFPLFSFDPAKGSPTLTEWLAVVHWEDRDLVVKTVERMFREGVSGDITYRIVHPAHGLRIMHSVGEPVSEDGRVTRLIGNTLDITEQELAEEAARAARARFEGILEIADDAIISVDSNQRIVLFNQGAKRVFGYVESEVIGKPLDLLIPESFRSAHRKHIKVFARSPEVARPMGQRREVSGRRKDGREFPAEASISKLDIDGEPVFTVILRDITERKRAEQRLVAQHTVTQVLAEAATLEEATPRILQALCECLAWDLGELWRLDRAAGVLRCVEVWHKKSLAAPQFVATSHERTFRPGKGLPGRVWASRAPAYIPDVVQESNFPRGPIAAQEGLHAAFGFPLLLGDEVVGVMDFFSQEIRQPDQELLDMMATIGSQIGQFIERKLAEEAVRALEKHARSLVTLRADVSAELAKPGSTKEILRGCAEALVRHLDAAFVRIWTLKSEADLLELQASAGLYTRLDGSFGHIEVGTLKVGRIAQEKKPHLTNDVFNDPEVWDKEWASSSGLVSFAGYPLIVDERVVGVMAMFARHPLPQAAVDTLASVADAMAQGIERKRAEEELRRSEAYLAEAQRLSTTGSFGWKPLSGEIVWSDETFRIFGIDRAVEPTLEFVLQATHPADRDRVQLLIERATREAKDWDLKHRIRMPDGAVKHLHVVAHAVYDESSDRTEYVGAVMDVTAATESRQALEKTYAEIQALKEQLQRENVVLREEFDKTSMFEEIVGTSAPLRSMLAYVARVAPTDSTVLITGETGTGKELIARAIHKRSKRSSRVFVSVNCAAIPAALIASELFGHEKGAFTGALQRRSGRFELAEGGTIFLDVVGELPHETQLALLRVLQEREFERVGGGRPIRTDVRVVAATNRNLEEAVAAGAFRTDLFYRLNVVPIAMPPLRERREDIPLLVEYFVDRYARQTGKGITRVCKKSLALLQAYSWPGNIRELQNVVERSVILADTDTLTVDEWWLPAQAAPPAPGQQPFAAQLDAQEKAMIEAVLTETQGRVSGPTGAAARLQMPPSTLESRIRSLGIDKRRFRRVYAVER